MKNNCFINVKVLFENVRVRVSVRVSVRVRPYPPFPTTLLQLFVNRFVTLAAAFDLLMHAPYYKVVYIISKNTIKTLIGMFITVALLYFIILILGFHRYRKITTDPIPIPRSKFSPIQIPIPIIAIQFTIISSWLCVTVLVEYIIVQ